MKILVVSDDHFSVSSSILNRRSGYKFSARLDALVSTYEWISRYCSRNGIDWIVHCGDITDSDILSPEVSAALSKALSYVREIPITMILGNHERKDLNGLMNSVALLSNYKNLNLITDLESEDVQAGGTPGVDWYKFIYVPYTRESDQYVKVYDLIREATSQVDNTVPVVFSHMPYTGEYYGSYMETDGLERELMKPSNDHYTIIFNGHIHNPLSKASSDRKWYYYQVGSSIGGGFNDLYTQSTPRVLIFSTDDGSIKSVANPYSPVFYKAKVDTVGELAESLKRMTVPDEGSLLLRVTCSDHVAQHVTKYLQDNADALKLMNFSIRAEVTHRKSTKSSGSAPDLEKFTDPLNALSQFYSSQKVKKFSEDEVTGFLDRYVKEKGGTADVSQD